jgi:exonuclease VII small subunit
LSRKCGAMLDETEKKVSQLMGTGEESFRESPVEAETDSDT